MKNALIAASLLLCSAAQAQLLDATAPLKTYAARALPQCPGGSLSIEPLAAGGPVNFKTYRVTLRSSDEYCGTQKFLLHSPKSQQVVLGSLITLPNDARTLQDRISAQATQLLNQKVSATVSPFPLPDGLKSVSINRTTPWGPFAYLGFVDSSGQYLIVGSRGSLSTDPARSLRDALGVAGAARRGNANAKLEILELSDFQCPTCAHAHEKIEPLIQKNLSKMNYLRLDLPLFEHHDWALPAAMGSRAIQKVAPAKYWDYVDYIFKNQQSMKAQTFDRVFQEYCEDHDIDWAAVKKIYTSATERKAMLEQVSRAFAAGIASTPTFIVNGQVMGFGPDGAFTIAAINRALSAGASAPAKKSGK